MKKFTYIFCVALLTISFLAVLLLAEKEPSHRAGPLTLILFILAFISPKWQPSSLLSLSNLKLAFIAVILLLLARRFYLFFANRSLDPPEQFNGFAYGLALVTFWCFSAAVGLVILMAISYKGGGASFIPVFMSFMPAAFLLPISFLITEIKSLKAGLLTNRSRPTSPAGPRP